MSFSQCPPGDFLKKQVVSLVAILFGLNVSATLMRAEEAHSSPAVAKSCLWEVSSQRGTVFLLGSVHLLKPGTYPASPAAEAALQQAKAVVLEVDLDKIDSLSTQQLIRSKGLLDGETLEAKVSSETLALVIRKTEAMGLPFDQIRSLKPWLLTVTLTAIKLRTLGFDPRHGIDRYFFDKAKLASKEILSLETMEYQLNQLDGMSAKIQEQALLQTLEDLDTLQEEFEELLEAWSRGEVEVLEDLLFKGFEGFPQVFEKLITERNRNWLPKIEEFLDQPGTTLVVVGAAHLVGSEGVVKLLEKRGYQVRQL